MPPDVPPAFARISDPGSVFLAEAAYLWLTLGQPAKAQRMFHHLAVLFPEHHLPALGLAECSLDLGDPSQAIRAAQAAATLGGHSRQSLAWTVLVEAKAHVRADRARDALRTLRQAEALDAQGPIGRLARTMAGVLDPPRTFPPPRKKEGGSP